MCVQVEPSTADTIGTKTFVQISEVSLFQGENGMYYIESVHLCNCIIATVAMPPS